MNPLHLEMLRSAPIFEGLPEEDFPCIEQRLIVLRFEQDDLVFREGAPGRYICFVVEGQLEVVKGVDPGRAVPIARIGPGRSVGEMSIVDGSTCSATVVARTPTMVLALTREHFDALVTEHPRLGVEIYRGISKLLAISLRQTSEDLAEARTPGDGRLPLSVP
ncbi:MAG: cyclic nucleotide-binding domain-containing protein [Pseudomonadales bacterium]|jgi:CRP-like cAMP-binding protein|nr:cyclic nucleotide-binding domain-containing protein [Pseudomonadales bacterium]